jgi:outer membrane assembly lipoprotein YfiO
MKVMGINLFKSYRYVVIVVVLLALNAGCAKEQNKSKMSFNELTTHAQRATQTKNHDEAIGYLDEALCRFADNEKIHQVKMNLAELHFNNGDYAVAHELYENFNQLYPADEQAEYAKYKSILSMYKQTLAVHCDQTETEETVKLCREYFQNVAYKKFHKEVKDIQTLCDNKLFNKEVYVFNFYFNKGKYDAARYRLKTMRNKLASLTAAHEDQILYLECQLAQKEKNKKLIRKNLDELRMKYPTSEFTLMAHNLTARRPFIF